MSPPSSLAHHRPPFKRMIAREPDQTDRLRHASLSKLWGRRPGGLVLKAVCRLLKAVFTTVLQAEGAGAAADADTLQNERQLNLLKAQ